MGRPVVMKRPTQTTAHKSEKTAEFVIPDLALIKSDSQTVVPTMADMPPPVAPLRVKAVEEKQAALTKIDQEIAETKQDAVRKVDEKTQMFNLRQLELEAKTQELEEKKSKMEKELHDELKQITSGLLEETKKISGLETVVDSVQKVRLEMIRLFNQGLDDRKKNYEELATTKSEITKMHALVQETVGDLSLAYRDILAASKRTLNDFESDSVKVLMAKQELDKVALEKERLDNQLAMLSKELVIVETKLTEARQETATKETLLRKLEQEVHEHETKLHGLQDSSSKLVSEITARESELQTVRAQLKQTHVESENLKVSMGILQGTFDRKTKALTQMENEMSACGERTENMRQTEIEMMRTIANLESSRSVAQADVDGMNSQKNALQEIIREMKQLHQAQEQGLEEKKAELAQRCKTEEERYRMELQQKTHDWELQFSEHCVTRKAELTKELDEMSLKHSQSLLQLKERFVQEGKKAAIDVLDVKEFASREERQHALAAALDMAVSDHVLSPLVNYSQRWKVAFGASAVMSAVLTGLLVWKW